jgi:hypothetical protein
MVGGINPLAYQLSQQSYPSEPDFDSSVGILIIRSGQDKFILFYKAASAERCGRKAPKSPSYAAVLPPTGRALSLAAGGTEKTSAAVSKLQLLDGGGASRRNIFTPFYFVTPSRLV